MSVIEKKVGIETKTFYLKSNIYLKCISCLILLQFNPSFAANPSDEQQPANLNQKMLQLSRNEDAEPSSTSQSKLRLSETATKSVTQFQYIAPENTIARPLKDKNNSQPLILSSTKTANPPKKTIFNSLFPASKVQLKPYNGPRLASVNTAQPTTNAESAIKNASNSSAPIAKQAVTQQRFDNRNAANTTVVVVEKLPVKPVVSVSSGNNSVVSSSKNSASVNSTSLSERLWQKAFPPSSNSILKPPAQLAAKKIRTPIVQNPVFQVPVQPRVVSVNADSADTNAVLNSKSKPVEPKPVVSQRADTNSSNIQSAKPTLSESFALTNQSVRVNEAALKGAQPVIATSQRTSTELLTSSQPVMAAQPKQNTAPVIRPTLKPLSQSDIVIDEELEQINAVAITSTKTLPEAPLPQQPQQLMMELLPSKPSSPTSSKANTQPNIEQPLLPLAQNNPPPMLATDKQTSANTVIAVNSSSAPQAPKPQQPKGLWTVLFPSSKQNNAAPPKSNTQPNIEQPLQPLLQVSTFEAEDKLSTQLDSTQASEPVATEKVASSEVTVDQSVKLPPVSATAMVEAPVVAALVVENAVVAQPMIESTAVEKSVVAVPVLAEPTLESARLTVTAPQKTVWEVLFPSSKPAVTAQKQSKSNTVTALAKPVISETLVVSADSANQAAQTTAVETAAVETTAVETDIAETSKIQQAAVESVVDKNAAVETTLVSTSAVATPVVEVTSATVAAPKKTVWDVLFPSSKPAVTAQKQAESSPVIASVKPVVSETLVASEDFANQAAETTAAETTAVETTAVETTAVETTAGEITAVETAVAETSTVQQPVVESDVAKNAAIETTRVQTSAVTTPVVEVTSATVATPKKTVWEVLFPSSKSAATAQKQPESTLATTSTELPKPVVTEAFVVTKPAVQTAAVETSTFVTSTIAQPDVESVVDKNAAIETTRVQTPAVTTPVVEVTSVTVAAPKKTVWEVLFPSSKPAVTAKKQPESTLATTSTELPKPVVSEALAASEVASNLSSQPTVAEPANVENTDVKKTTASVTAPKKTVWEILFPSSNPAATAQKQPENTQTIVTAQPVVSEALAATDDSANQTSAQSTTAASFASENSVITSTKEQSKSKTTKTKTNNASKQTLNINTEMTADTADYTVLASTNADQTWQLAPKANQNTTPSENVSPMSTATKMSETTNNSVDSAYNRWMLEPRPTIGQRILQDGKNIGSIFAPQPNDSFRTFDMQKLTNFSVAAESSEGTEVVAPIGRNNAGFDTSTDVMATNENFANSELGNTSQQALLMQPRLTLADAVRIGVLRHPQITQSISRLASQNANIDVAKSQFYPQLSTGISTGDLTSSNNGGQQFTFNLQQALFDFGKIKTNVNTEQAKLQVEQANVLLNIDDIALKIANAVVNIKRFEAISKIAQQQVDGTQRILEIAKLRAQAGISSQADPVQAQTFLESAQSNLIAQKSLMRENQLRLRTLLNVDVSRKDFDIPEDLVQISDLYATPEFNKIPSMIVAQSNVEVAKSQRKLSELNRYPTLLLRGSVAQSLNGRNIDNNQNDSTDSAILLEATSNFFQGGLNASQIKAASFAEQAAKAEVNSTYLNVLDNIRTNREQIENKQAQIKVLVDRQKSTIRTRELYQEQYKLGTRTVLDLLNAEQAIHVSNTELQNARYDIYNNLVQYIATTGRSRDAYDLNSLTIQGVEIQP